MDAIVVRDILASVHIGVPDQERAEPQNVLISMELRLDLERAATSDSLADTLDYGTLVAEVVEVAEGSSVRLLEHLAGRVAAFIMDLPGVQGVTVEVAKETPPIAQTVGGVAVRLERGL
jgi:dihydroneopterin aldolase